MSDKEISDLEKSDAQKNAETKKQKKPSMSFITSFGLSLKNLLTKKGRTVLTSFAGSIGIIGIALIFAVSQGMTTYINTVQEETLSSYPLTLEAQHLDMSTILATFMGSAVSNKEHQNDKVYQKGMLYDMINTLNSLEANENDLASFKKYLEAELKKEGDTSLKEAINGVQYTYDMPLLIYTENVDGNIILSDTESLMQDLLLEYFGMDLSGMMSMSEMSPMGSMASMSPMGTGKLWQEMLPGENGKLINNLLDKQYDVIYGSWPTEYNEIVLVVDENNEIDDMTLYALGLKSKEDIDALADAAFNKTEVNADLESWTYEQILDMEFRTVFGSDCYTYDSISGTYTDLRKTNAGLKYLYDNGTSLKISGIIRPKDDSVASMLTGTICYTSKLTKYIIENAKDSPAVNAQLSDKTTDIFTGLPFKENTGNLTNEEKIEEFKEYVNTLDDKGKASAYIKIMSIPSKEYLDMAVAQTLENTNREKMEATLVTVLIKQMGMAEEDVKEYISSMKDEDITKMFTEMVIESTKMQYAAGVKAQLTNMSEQELVAAFMMAFPTYTEEQLITYHDEVLVFSESSYDENLRELGVVDIESPSTINIYASTFENKDIIEDAIADYNKDLDELEKITYTDYVGLMMSSITIIINAITYVLIAFVAISLIVSSIMIGVITLISVQERTKEIGILRAIGASKKNVSSMFNAETVIIGFTSGALGVLVTYLLCIPINAILHALTGINNLNAILPPEIAVILVIISVILTLFAGIIPSKSAAKKDPVVALRSE